MLHNHYGGLSGESTVFYELTKLLQDHGHQVYCWTRTTENIEKKILGKTRAFFAGIYNIFSVKEIKRLISKYKPHISHHQYCHRFKS